MRYLATLLILILLSACGTNRIRYVRAKGQPQKIVDASVTENRSENHNNDLVIAQSESGIEEVYESTQYIDPPSDNQPDQAKNRVSELTTEKEIFQENEKDPRLDAAKDAEKYARKSRKNLRLSVIFLGLSFIPFLSILFFIPAFILLIIGGIQYAIANSSRYITQKGQDMLKTAKVYLLVWLIIVLLILLLSLAIVFIFL